MRRGSAIVGSGVFFVAAPVVVAGAVPALLTGWRRSGPWGDRWGLRLAGAGLVVAGVAVLLSAFARFALDGRGTPAPVAPTEQLVVSGLYRRVRNPMYLAVVGVIVGQALLLARYGLLAYGAAVWAVTALFVRLYEEPTLARRYGPAYDRYRREVPAWRPRLGVGSGR